MATLTNRECEKCGNCNGCKIKEIYEKNVEIMKTLALKFEEPKEYDKCFTTSIQYDCAFYDWHNNNYR